MKFFISIFILVFLFSCDGKSNSNQNLELPRRDKDQIKEIQIYVEGGLLSSKVCYIINADSIIYKYSDEHNFRDVKTIKQKNTETDWQKILNVVDVNNFKSAQNGKSLQPVDGLDTKITIKLKGSSYSKTNANENKSWNGIMEIVREFKR